MIDLHLQHFLLYLHLIALCGALVGISMADHAGFGWIRGSVATLEGVAMDQLHMLVAFSLSFLIVTGIWLAWPMREFVLHDIFFLMKMVFVGILVVNAVLIEYLMPVATQMPFAAVPVRRKLALFASGALSTTSWFGAIVTAYLAFGWLF